MDDKKKFYEEQAKKYKQFTFTLDDKASPAIEKPLTPIKKEKVFSVSSDTISKSHTVQFSEPQRTSIQFTEFKRSISTPVRRDEPVSPKKDMPISPQRKDVTSSVKKEPEHSSHSVSSPNVSSPGSSSSPSTSPIKPNNVYAGRININNNITNPRHTELTRGKAFSAKVGQSGEVIGNSLSGGLSDITRKLYSNIEQGDSDSLKVAEKTKDAVVLVSSINATGRSIQRASGNVHKILSDNKTRLQNAGRYIKGMEKEEFKKFRNFDPFTVKQYNKKLMEFSDLKDLNMKDIRAEIKQLTGLKELTADQAKRLTHLKNYKDLVKKGKLLGLDKTTMRNSGFVVKNGIVTLLRQGDDSAMDGMLKAADVAGNRYVRTAIKTSAKVTYSVTKKTAQITGKAAVFIGDKTGVNKQIAKGVEKVAKTTTIQNAKKIVTITKQGVHGGAYKVLANHTPEAVKKTYSVTKTAVTSLGRGIDKVTKPVRTVAKGVGKGVHYVYKAVSAPFVAAKKATLAVKRLIGALLKYLGIGILALLLVVVIIGAFQAVVSSVLSIFMSDVPNIQKYADYVVELQDAYIAEIEEAVSDAMDDNDSLNEATYEYIGKASVSNGKEILSMAAVYHNQDWPDWYEFIDNNSFKDYIKSLFDDSHSYTIELSDEYECAGCKERDITTYCSGCEEDDEGNETCPGHDDTEIYCSGHRDVTVTVETLTFDAIYSADSKGAVTSAEWDGWIDDNKEWCKNLYLQDWFDLYGVSFGGDDFVPHPISSTEKVEIMEKVMAECPTLSEERKQIIETALSISGSVPYFWGGGHHAGLERGIDPAWGTEMRVVYADGYDAQPAGTFHLYGLDCSGFTRWVIYTATGVDSMYAGATGQRVNLGRAVSRSNIKPGDFGNTSDDGHVGIYLYTDTDGQMVFIHCSPSVNGVNVNKPGYFTRFYTPRSIT